MRAYLCCIAGKRRYSKLYGAARRTSAVASNRVTFRGEETMDRTESETLQRAVSIPRFHD